jgi:hypothetical protein
MAATNPRIIRGLDFPPAGGWECAIRRANGAKIANVVNSKDTFLAEGLKIDENLSFMVFLPGGEVRRR